MCVFAGRRTPYSVGMDPRRPQLQLPRSRPAGIAATLLAQAALIAAWQQVRGPTWPEQGAAGFVQSVQVPPPSREHGKQRITNCGRQHEQPVNPQAWRTARD